MNYITVLRRIVEELDYCDTFSMQYLDSSAMVVIYFYYTDPIDSVIWTIDSNFFNINLRRYFELASEKQIEQPTQ